MSEGLRERFINALTATMELYDVIVDEQGKKIATLEDAVLRLQGEIHEQQHVTERLNRDTVRALQILEQRTEKKT